MVRFLDAPWYSYSWTLGSPPGIRMVGLLEAPPGFRMVEFLGVLRFFVLLES